MAEEQAAQRTIALNKTVVTSPTGASDYGKNLKRTTLGGY